MSILGNRVLRKEDPRFLRGEGRYVENLTLEGAASVTFVRSLLAHARITGDRRLGRRSPPERASPDRVPISTCPCTGRRRSPGSTRPWGGR